MRLADCFRVRLAIVGFYLAGALQCAVAQLAPPFDLTCNANSCFCILRDNIDLMLADTRTVTDAGPRPTACTTVYLNFELRITDGGTLGSSRFDPARAAVIGSRITQLIEKPQYPPVYLQCQVDSWFKSPKLKPSVLNGTCVLVCAGSPRCDDAILAVNTSFQSIQPALFQDSPDPIPLGKSRFLTLAVQPMNNFVFNRSSLQSISDLDSDSRSQAGGSVDPGLMENESDVDEGDNPEDNQSPQSTDLQGDANKPGVSSSSESDDGADADSSSSNSNTEADGNTADSGVTPTAATGQSDSILNNPRKMLNHPGVIAALVAAGLLVVSLSVLLVLFTVKRFRKRDRGSYVLDDAHRKAPLLGSAAHAPTNTQMFNGYPSPPAREFYA